MSILFNNPLLGASGQGPSADLGDTIEQSLRFRSDATTNLSRTPSSSGNRQTWTYSFWFKLGKFGSSSTFICVNAGANNSLFSELVLESSDRFTFQGYTVSYFIQERKLRDPSAWYHIVLIADTTNATAADRLRFYVNGERETSFTTQTNPGLNDNFAINFADPTVIGLRAGTTLNKFEGELAQVYFIDGTAISETSGVIDEFGRYNEDGVWVPQDYTGSYGTNGFHLTFDSSQSPNGIGTDSSGQNNHWTASGFDTGDVALYSKDLSLTSGTESSSNPFENAFDGSTSTFATCNESSGTFSFNPDPAISHSSSVQVRVNDSNATATIGSTTVNLTANSLTTVVSGSGSFGAGGNALVIANTTTNPQIEQIAVDGTILIDNTDNDVDFNDTPTSNYAVWNPLYYTNSNGVQRYNEANLALDLSSASTLGYYRFFYATLALPKTGKWYFEHQRPVTRDSADPSGQFPFVGFSTLQGNFQDESTTRFYNVVSICGGTGYGYRYGSSTSTAYGSIQGNGAWPAGAVIGCTYDADTRQVRFYKDGSDMGLFDTLPADTDFYIAFAQNYVHSVTKFNFGQMPFIYTPPTGFIGLQTNELPEPTIKNGKEYFDTVLYSGTNNSNAITGLEFSPDLIWIKVRDAADNHVLVDTIRGTDSVLFSNSPDQQASSFSRFTSFDSNGFTVDSSDTAWNNSSNDYVAWCWKAGGTAVANTDGTINSNVSANTDAGFSIVSYTGTGSNATVGHGLNSPPEFVIVKNREGGQNWAVGSDAIDNWGTVLYLNNDQAKEPTAGSTYWNSLAPTASVINIGSAANTNSTNNMIAYCWHSVEGYSKFGKYDANDNADGTFVYLGFRPAMIILKSIGLGYDWFIWDTARDTSNPSATVLKPDLTQDEAAAGSPATEIDILSNGFKIRGANQVNQLTDHIYCAWAESPFGGENAPPATAR